MLEIVQTNENNYISIAVTGDADASSSIKLDKGLRSAFDESHSNIIIDCTNLNYISSAGLGVFMSYIEEINQTNTTFIIYGLSEKVLKVFGILGLDQLLILKNTKEEALAEINGL
ncbi:STAS domain-containing protein [uncultured Roseivirga sp.]|uniref:STAS domain-containing protein n=1 Tax=uncultured Roseivirga sp. TaxID=543088 RepID=UPI0030D76B3A|tara:strand:+ start:39871 stop:40215 length:345 start_codon:yes stop_codon:yes gene_type:complete